MRVQPYAASYVCTWCVRGIICQRHCYSSIVVYTTVVMEYNCGWLRAALEAGVSHTIACLCLLTVSTHSAKTSPAANTLAHCLHAIWVASSTDCCRQDNEVV